MEAANLGLCGGCAPLPPLGSATGWSGDESPLAGYRDRPPVWDMGSPGS